MMLDDFKESKLWLVITENGTCSFTGCKLEVARYIEQGMGCGGLSPKTLCRVFTFPDLREITKTKILLQESE
jgi:hypothetical protein